MAQMTPVFSPKEDDSSDESPVTGRGHRCCFFWSFPCFNTRHSDSWERISTSDRGDPHDNNINDDQSWWGRGMTALKKVREWSELVAGPKWKTFIRRFNRTTGRSKTGKFQYDPLSYALNFDEGPAQNGQLEDDWFFRNFTSRYVAVQGQNGNSKEGASGNVAAT